MKPINKHNKPNEPNKHNKLNEPNKHNKPNNRQHGYV